MISIINNSATIQINGDTTATIIKANVVNVQSIGVMAVIHIKENGIDRRVRIDYTRVNQPNTFATVQMLVDYISSILGTFDVPVLVKNTNGTYAELATFNPFILPDTPVQIVVNGTQQPVFSVPTLDDNTINIVWTF